MISGLVLWFRGEQVHWQVFVPAEGVPSVVRNQGYYCGHTIVIIQELNYTQGFVIHLCLG
jgi:hypothetical protein